MINPRPAGCLLHTVLLHIAGMCIHTCERETERDRDTSHATELESAFLVW